MMGFIMRFLINVLIIFGVTWVAQSENWLKHNSQSHFFPSTKPTWDIARSECESRNSKLAVITNQEEMNFLKGELVRRKEVHRWIGLRRYGEDCTCNGVTATVCSACRESWEWYDKTTMEFNKWFDNRPWLNRACGLARDGGVFESTSCTKNNTFSFICQYDCSTKGCQIESCDFAQGRYICTCIDGFTGTRCDRDINDCTSSSCQNGGSCVEIGTGFRCSCLDGFNGASCEININECEDDPCSNGGSCIDGVNDFDCTCVNGYSGTVCDIDIDDCVPDQCQNGGRCIDAVANFTCDCPSGYYGRLCELDTKECQSNPCINGGSCVEGVASFTCDCPGGVNGTLCEIDINECESEPCLNGGNCTNGFNEFSCHCGPMYTGNNCEFERSETTNKHLPWIDRLDEKALQISLIVGVVLLIPSMAGCVIISIIYYKASKTWNEDDEPKLRQNQEEKDRHDKEMITAGGAHVHVGFDKSKGAVASTSYD